MQGQNEECAGSAGHDQDLSRDLSLNSSLEVKRVVRRVHLLGRGKTSASMSFSASSSSSSSSSSSANAGGQGKSFSSARQQGQAQGQGQGNKSALLLSTSEHVLAAAVCSPKKVSDAVQKEATNRESLELVSVEGTDALTMVPFQRERRRRLVPFALLLACLAAVFVFRGLLVLKMHRNSPSARERERGRPQTAYEDSFSSTDFAYAKAKSSSGPMDLDLDMPEPEADVDSWRGLSAAAPLRKQVVHQKQKQRRRQVGASRASTGVDDVEQIGWLEDGNWEESRSESRRQQIERERERAVLQAQVARIVRALLAKAKRLAGRLVRKVTALLAAGLRALEEKIA